ncbi:MAG: DUF305 domain-containing protein [Pyrinomonadaceae bacterium]|nr:DUF305 domain-containing protein [Pyrinomonadaceae bacterium]
MKRTSVKSITLLALVALLAFGASALAHEPTWTAVHDSPPDVEFIDMMMMHHQQGIEMARLAEGKATLPRLKEFARKSAEDQQLDMEKLQGIREQHFANVPKADKMRMNGKAMTMREMQRMSQADMQRLQAASGAEFDHAFLDIYTKHHQMALQMSRNEEARGERQELKDMARETIAKQTRAIGEMREMKRQVSGARNRTDGHAHKH